ncbi:RICIN domain-containing protein [Streptomyces sp. NPDC005574]|uniref:ricin-type beta-trefoil lectin domain protein n=1 Tax=Streptomyces sp. NPDC005574 TaxID=3156891 RepID=UPI0033A1AB5D
MRLRPPRLISPAPGRPKLLTRLIPPVLAVAVLAGLTARPDLLDRDTGRDAVPASDSYDGFDSKAAEQLRADQCVGVDALRKGGPSLFALAQNAIGLPPDQLHQKLDRDLYNESTPLHQAFYADNASSDQWVKKAGDQGQAWSGTVSGLESYPDAPRDANKIFDQVGLLPWLYQSYFKSVDLFSPFYEPSPTADDATKAAALAVGDPLYTTGGTQEEQQAWALWKKNSGKIQPNQLFVPRVFADDARIFLSSGGFPRTAPAADTAEFRIAVEDLKARFASCAWHDPIDPNRVLGKEVAQASAEWQQEIAAQATPRQQILAGNVTATKALQDGTFTLGQILGQSWLADYATRWQDYWSAGGVGWIGDSYVTIEVPGAAGSCLDVQGGAKTNGTPVQIYTCNGGASQQWTLEGGEDNLHLRNVGSQKCLDVAGNASANGTKIQISDCYKSDGQSWKGDVRATAPLKSVSTGKCLDLSAFTKSTDARLFDCKNAASQKFLIKPSGHQGSGTPLYPDKAQFDKAKKVVTDAQAAAKKQLATLRTQLDSATKAATASDTAEQAAYGIADATGAPRGRGLLVGQQKAQVTKGSVAALTAMVKAGETAEAATRAAAGDSATITQRALAQAAQVNAEFRKEAAHAAELQAKAAADAAKLHRDNAKRDKETAEAKLAVALKAEGDARSAAADAHAKRLAAEAEEATAKAEKETAAAKQAEANEHKQNAQAEAAKAKDAKDKAEASEKTAESRRDDAVTARDNAKDKRDDAWDAEQKADAARAKADAKDAYADSLDSGEAADAARTAANEADRHADDAESAAGRARSEADAATQAAAEADAAATRAEAAAKRARSDADAAQAAKLKADAAVKTATSAAADAIQAAAHAADEAKTAVKLADEAEALAKTAMADADAANKEAGKALAAAAKAAGFAHVTAQAAVDAGNAASQVAKPANDAIELGSPYVDTDSAAGLVVLAGQASKSIADQQKAVADAHAQNAQAEAAAAKNLADQAKGDTKIAYQYAADAAAHAADARGYAKEALGYAADAAEAASKASASLARSKEYDRQATVDAAAADKAAGRAEGYAADARSSADQAALDADAARTAASEAEQSAKDARAAADRADAAATEAEEAAKDAAKYAKEAQEAADRTEREEANKGASDGVGTGVPGVFAVPDESTVEIVSSKQIGTCPGMPEAAFQGCNAKYDLVVTYEADFYLCTDEQAQATADGCPKSAWTFLQRSTLKNIKIDGWTHTFSGKDIVRAGWQSLFGDVAGSILFSFFAEDLMDCWHGDKTACAWSLATYVPLESLLAPIARAVKALDAAAKTGIGFTDAWKALRTLHLSDEAIAGLGAKAIEALGKARKWCGDSFPGTTRVLMADGTTKEIKDVRIGDAVLATDPESGLTETRTVSRTIYTPDDTDFAAITIDVGNARITATQHHPFWSPSAHRWIDGGDLRPGQTLRTSSGATVTVLRVHTFHRLHSAYNLTVDRLHTYYVLAGTTPVLVHNANGCPTGTMVLGIGSHSEALAKEIKEGYTFNGDAFAEVVGRVNGKPIALWMTEVSNVLRNNGKVAVTLKGFDGDTPAEQFALAYKAWRSGDWAATQWEMGQIGLQIQLGNFEWRNITFYSKEGKVVPRDQMPEPNWDALNG